MENISKQLDKKTKSFGAIVLSVGKAEKGVAFFQRGTKAGKLLSKGKLSNDRRNLFFLFSIFLLSFFYFLFQFGYLFS